MIAAFGALDQAFAHRSTHQFGCQPVELLLVALREHLGIACHTQHRGELAQFVEDPGVGVVGQSGLGVLQ